MIPPVAAWNAPFPCGACPRNLTAHAVATIQWAGSWSPYLRPQWVNGCDTSTPRTS